MATPGLVSIKIQRYNELVYPCQIFPIRQFPSNFISNEELRVQAFSIYSGKTILLKVVTAIFPPRACKMGHV